MAILQGISQNERSFNNVRIFNHIIDQIQIPTLKGLRPVMPRAYDHPERIGDEVHPLD